MEGGGVLQPSPFTPLELGSSTSARISFYFSLLSSQYLRWVINRGMPRPHVLERQMQTGRQGMLTGSLSPRKEADGHTVTNSGDGAPFPLGSLPVM